MDFNFLDKKPAKGGPKKGNDGSNFSGSITGAIFVFMLITALYLVMSDRALPPVEIPISDLAKSVSLGEVKRIEISGENLNITYHDDVVKKSKKDKTEEAETETPAPKAFKPKMASIPKEYDPTKITLKEALMFLSLPRTLGAEPKTGLPVVATTGRFGPFVAHDKNFRSIKPPLSVYTITFEEALALLAIAKKPRGFQKKKK